MVHSVLHYFDFKATLFELVPDNNPNYFDSLPQTLLQWRVDSNIMSGSLLTKYKQLLSGLKNGATSLPPKIMSGLESYNICYSPEYSIKFGYRHDSSF